MCGLAGILRITSPDRAAGVASHLDVIPEAWLDALDESIMHRGPDGAARFRDRRTRGDGSIVDVALVHRRLAIIDPEGAHQPMVHDGERLRPDLTYPPGGTPFVASERLAELGEGDLAGGLVCVAFNGCVYNHRELRGELESLGHAFGTDHSDTEALVHGWRAWGRALPRRLDEMGAWALWDASSAELIRARDRAGEKPLWIGSALDGADGSPATTVLCSVPAGALRFMARRLGVPGPGAIDLGWVADGWSGGAVGWGVLAASPASCAESSPRGWGSGAGVMGWVPPARAARAPEDATGLVDRAIERAVLSRLEADVPLGCFLSGGIDSALIASAVRRSGRELKTFTVRMPDARYDESEAACVTARHLGTDHTTLDCDARPAEDLVRLIERLGLPFADSSLLPTYWVCRAAGEHVKVALTGDGGDELFGGYQRHVAARHLGRARWLARCMPLSVIPQRDPKSLADKLARLLRGARHAGHEDLVRVFPTPMLRRVVPRAFAAHPGLGVPLAVERADPLLLDFLHYLPCDLLTKADTASMGVPIETRAPLLSRELVELVFGLPLETIMPGGERKGLLKRVARRHLPAEIVDRPKMGFAIPIGDWFRSDHASMRTLLLDHLTGADPFPGLDEMGIDIDRAYVRTLLGEHDRAGEASVWPWKGRDHAQRLYLLLVLSIWAKWLARSRREAPVAPGGEREPGARDAR